VSKLTKQYTTSLEIAKPSEINAVLDAKLDATSSQSLTDYVGLTLDNLEAKIERIKQAEKDMKLLKDDTQCQIDVIKGGVSKWLTECGVDKLDGDIISSVKVTQPKPSEELIITTDTDSLINMGYFKTTVDETAIKKDILSGVDVDGAKIEVTHKEDSIAVYKKRK